MLPGTLPWYEPPFMPHTTTHVIDTPMDHRTPEEIVTYLKGKCCLKLFSGKQPRELEWITTFLTSDPTEDTVLKYSEREARASLCVAIDILSHNDGIRHSGFEDQTQETFRGLLGLMACAIQYDLAVDPGTIENLAESFSFVEIQKNSLQTRLCSVLCDTVIDKDILRNSGGIPLPMRHMSLFLAFAPIADDTIKTSLPIEVMLALHSHKALL
jgi:hypothetical protein